MNKCLADGNEVTKAVKSVELGYFQSARLKHKIPLELDDKEYKKYFLKWLKLQNDLGIINQMMLFANGVNGLTADVCISMLVECYEALGRKLERLHFICCSRAKYLSAGNLLKLRRFSFNSNKG